MGIESFMNNSGISVEAYIAGSGANRYESSRHWAEKLRLFNWIATDRFIPRLGRSCIPFLEYVYPKQWGGIGKFSWAKEGKSFTEGEWFDIHGYGNHVPLPCIAERDGFVPLCIFDIGCEDDETNELIAAVEIVVSHPVPEWKVNLCKRLDIELTIVTAL